MATQDQKFLSDGIAKYQQLDKDKQKVIGLIKQLDVQLNENSAVKEELDLLDKDARVFKLVGPALLRQDLKEAKDNVNNRIKYIAEEMARHEKTMKEIEAKMASERATLESLQQKMQSMQVAKEAK